MSWTNELYKVYELAVKRGSRPGEPILLPVSHSTANAQIEVVIDENGEFISASAVSKENTVTIIPVTEASGARSSGIAPMPLADKLVYIAKDYSIYADGKRADNSSFYSAYMEQLQKWCSSDAAVPEVNAIYKYLEKGKLIHDLISGGMIELDEIKQKFTDKKINGIAQQDSFVRFIVSGREGLCYTWKDSKIYDSFICFNSLLVGSQCLCYATGDVGAVTYKHPAKIRNSGDKAKLISSNDESGFTYRGRFSSKEEAVSVSYNYSQKIHNALKWLVENQRITKTDNNGKSFSYNPMQFDSLTLVVWNSALGFVPSVTQSAFEMLNDDVEEYSSMPEFSKLLNKLLIGEGAELGDNKVMIMGLDAATPGRLSISLYTELSQSNFYANLKKWHEDTMWPRFNSKIKNNMIDSCSIIRIADCLYGTEQSGRLVCDKKVLRELILRLLPCVTEKRRLPRDIILKLYDNASKPLSYESAYNHRIVLENACALIRKEYKDYGKGEITMSYDPNNTDRSYLYGCLLAIADKAEGDTYEANEKRVTNARRFWNAFSARPYQTWQMIEERLEPYLEKKQWAMTKYTKHINEIMSKMTPEAFSNNSKLSPMYLIGYHHYSALLWNAKENNKEEE